MVQLEVLPMNTIKALIRGPLQLVHLKPQLKDLVLAMVPIIEQLRRIFNSSNTKNFYSKERNKAN